MKLSEIKSGMIIEVLNCGDVDRYLVCDINGVMTGFNDKYSLGEIEYFFDEDLNDRTEDVSLLSIYKIINDERAIMVAITDDKSLELIYAREYDNDCDCEEIQHLEAVIEELLDSNDMLRKENEQFRKAFRSIV